MLFPVFLGDFCLGMAGIVAVTGGCAPEAGHRNRAGIGLVAEEKRITADAPLFINVSLDHLGRDGRGFVAVFATFKKHDYHNLRIAAGRDPSEPAVAFVLLLGIGSV